MLEERGDEAGMTSRLGDTMEGNALKPVAYTHGTPAVGPWHRALYQRAVCRGVGVVGRGGRCSRAE